MRLVRSRRARSSARNAACTTEGRRRLEPLRSFCLAQCRRVRCAHSVAFGLRPSRPSQSVRQVGQTVARSARRLRRRDTKSARSSNRSRRGACRAGDGGSDAPLCDALTHASRQPARTMELDERARTVRSGTGLGPSLAFASGSAAKPLGCCLRLRGYLAARVVIFVDWPEIVNSSGTGLAKNLV